VSSIFQGRPGESNASSASQGIASKAQAESPASGRHPPQQLGSKRHRRLSAGSGRSSEYRAAIAAAVSATAGAASGSHGSAGRSQLAQSRQDLASSHAPSSGAPVPYVPKPGAKKPKTELEASSASPAPPFLSQRSNTEKLRMESLTD